MRPGLSDGRPIRANRQRIAANGEEENRNRGFAQLSTAAAFPTFVFQFAAMCADRLNRSEGRNSQRLIP